MNQTFNLKRFSNYFWKHSADNYKMYLMSLFVLIGILFVMMGFIAYMSGSFGIRDQIPFFIFVLMITGSIFSSLEFSDLGNKKRAISILTLPASHFEKYLTGWLFSFLIFQILYIPCFYLVDIIIQQILLTDKPDEKMELLNAFDSESGIKIVYLLYGILNSVALLGSIYFQKQHFLKTAFVVLILAFFLVFLNTSFLQTFISRDVRNTVPFGDLTLRLDEPRYINIQIPLQDSAKFGIVLYAVVILLWVCSYFKLKEKQV